VNNQGKDGVTTRGGLISKTAVWVGRFSHRYRDALRRQPCDRVGRSIQLITNDTIRTLRCCKLAVDRKCIILV
ncbi:hypothetical protein D041_0754B, partial [Vibrio parahaemolyticus EKP-008]